MIIRNPEFKELLQKGVQANEIKMDAIDIQSVIKSQQGALSVKRQGLAERLSFALMLNRKVPSTRIQSSENLMLTKKINLWLEDKIIQKSKIAFKKQKGKGLRTFNNNMFIYEKSKKVFTKSLLLFRKCFKICNLIRQKS